MNGLYYITNPKYYNLQNVLNRILLDIRFLTTGFYSDIASDVLAKLPTVSIRMAIAVVGVLPIMVIYPFFQKYFVKGITIGAVKG
jgi:putative aldouronate transport system permease protein